MLKDEKIGVKSKLTLREKLQLAFLKMFEKKLTEHIHQQTAFQFQNALKN